MISASQTLSAEKLAKIKDLNHELEKKYPRKTYIVILRGPKVHLFDSIYDRLREIQRCTRIEYPNLIRLFNEDGDDLENSIELGLDTYDEFLEALKPWPEDAFKEGIEEVRVVPATLTINILNVKQTKDISLESDDVKRLKHRYGVYDLQRAYDSKNEPTNRITGKVNTIFEYIEAIRNGVYFGSRKHIVSPNIMHGKICNKCGGVTHKEKDCWNKPKCLKCGSEEHKTDCDNLNVFCINCRQRDHQCNNDICEKLVEKTFSLNSFILKVLIGEGLIEDKFSILKTSEESRKLAKEKEQKKHQSIDEMIDSVMDKQLGKIENRIDRICSVNSENNNRLDNIKSKLENCEDTISNFKSSFRSMMDELSQSYQSKLDEFANLIQQNFQNANS